MRSDVECLISEEKQVQMLCHVECGVLSGLVERWVFCSSKKNERNAIYLRRGELCDRPENDPKDPKAG
jgi:hypothetical protein